MRPLIDLAVRTAAIFACFSCLSTGASAVGRPNIVVILSDDQGWGDLSLNGNRDLSTPEIDSLAHDGVSFDRFYVCPVCSPTRAEFLTGRYHPRSGVYSTSRGGERMDLDEVTIADTFRAAGYATAAFGKWHNGMQYPYHPNGRGFDEYYGFCSGHWGHYFSPMLEHNGRIVQGTGFVIDDFTERALQFMEQSGDKPFFVYLPLNTPHSPMQVPDRWWKAFQDKKLTMPNPNRGREELNHTRCALAMCENIDWNVGRILKKLDALGKAENTIVVYFSDNGPNGPRFNGGMRGHKGSTDEGGVRSPLLIRWPAKIKGGKRIAPISAAIDLLPTLTELASIKSQSKKPLDGISLAPLLLGETASAEDRMIFSHWRGKVSVRTQTHRLDHQGRLYDMIRDPGQNKDIAKEQSAVAAKLREASQRWRAELLPGLGKHVRPLLVGHPDFALTQLPARDASLEGGIRRSNRHPNCTYLKHWKSTQDKITWNIEVVESGTFDVELYYSCPQKDVGSTIELRFGDSRLRGEVTEPHDPPLVGRDQDRFPRMESYVKDFQPLKLGSIRLRKRAGMLTLSALNIPGSQAMEFRLLMLKRSTSESQNSKDR